MPSSSLPRTGSPESYRLQLPQEAEAQKGDSTCLRTQCPLAAETNGRRVFWTVLWLEYHGSGLREAIASKRANQVSAGGGGMPAPRDLPGPSPPNPPGGPRHR